MKIWLMTGSLWLALVCNLVHGDTVKVAAVDWCPQICVDKQNPGFVMETVKMIFKDSPYDLEIEIYPWTRAIKMVNAGEAQALLAPTKKEAPNLRYPVQAIGSQKMCFWTKPESTWQYTDINSLEAVQIGFAYDVAIAELSDYMKSHEERFQLMSFNHEYIVKSMKKLEFGWIDTFLLTHNFARYEFHALNVTNKVRLAGCLTPESYYMAFTARSRDPEKISKMMTFFDLKIKELKSSEKIPQIMSRYGLRNWQSTTQ